MRGRIKVADPRIYLGSAAYIHIREEVVDEYQTTRRMLSIMGERELRLHSES